VESSDSNDGVLMMTKGNAGEWRNINLVRSIRVIFCEFFVDLSCGLRVLISFSSL
jgi:hypothetical protein